MDTSLPVYVVCAPGQKPHICTSYTAASHLAGHLTKTTKMVWTIRPWRGPVR